MSAPQARLWLIALTSIVLAACASTPPAAPTIQRPGDRQQAAAPSTAPEIAFENEQRARALEATRRDMLADAALTWEILAALRPDVAEYRERLADSRQRIGAAVSERLPLAAQAAQRGDLDGATRQYLEVLALQPDNAAAADALRALERARNKRSYLGKYSRLTLARTPPADAEAAASAGELAGRNELEHASLLADSGEFDDAIGLLERHLTADRRDAAARPLLARVYFRKAESLLPRDRAAAVAALKKSIQWDPAATDAAARLKQLQNGTRSPPAQTAPADREAEAPPR